MALYTPPEYATTPPDVIRAVPILSHELLLNTTTTTAVNHYNSWNVETNFIGWMLVVSLACWCDAVVPGIALRCCVVSVYIPRWTRNVSFFVWKRRNNKEPYLFIDIVRARNERCGSSVFPNYFRSRQVLQHLQHLLYVYLVYRSMIWLFAHQVCSHGYTATPVRCIYLWVVHYCCTGDFWSVWNFAMIWLMCRYLYGGDVVRLLIASTTIAA